LPGFIINQDKLFAEVLETYIPHAKQFDFFVGYFFFSGFDGIYLFYCLHGIDDSGRKI